ncbi:MAG TPA: tol-pal system-associated acyl-CoA thioesterase [SAR86 cluster bacterium]|nr:tol-pal system-associated acyl-CoA thioesterase [SAR86 cluster bacterium]|tara:strand:+ start:18900 stop:19295 length:396 start_codon:yes stop_codon:yes gene_type:complete
MLNYKIRVYYEDTDAQGVVYYANYLRFFERARTEFLRNAGYEQKKLMKEGLIFVVRNVEMSLLKPAHLDDELSVNTELLKLGRVSFDFKQEIIFASNIITTAIIQCGCLDSNKFTPSPLPEYLHNGMKKLI